MKYKKESRNSVILTCIAVYVAAFAIILFVKRISWEVDFLWRIFPGITLPVIVLLIATAISILICRKYTAFREQ